MESCSHNSLKNNNFDPALSISSLFKTENPPVDLSKPMDLQDSQIIQDPEFAPIEQLSDLPDLKEEAPQDEKQDGSDKIYLNKADKITPLHNTAKCNFDKPYSDIETFIEMGCKTGDKNIYGQTPLHVAIIWGNLNFVKELFKYCSDNNVLLDLNIKDLEDADGRTAFERCFEKILEEQKNRPKFYKYIKILKCFLKEEHNKKFKFYPLHEKIKQYVKDDYKQTSAENIKLILKYIQKDYLEIKDQDGKTFEELCATSRNILNAYLNERKINLGIIHANIEELKRTKV